MTNIEIANLYERDIRNLINELNLFKHEENIWRTTGTIKNSCGNIALHIIGGLNYLIGATFSHTGYIRNRDEEFSKKGIARKIIVTQLEEIIITINKAVLQLTPNQLAAVYPIFFDKEAVTNSYVLTQLLLHINYHLGQVNYLRRTLE
jgi:Protein of unknown function (DUF1572)